MSPGAHSTSDSRIDARGDAREQDRVLHVPGRGVLVIGLGGLGSPALSVLVKSGVRKLTLVDADRVDETNLQRQILFENADVGRTKTEAAASALQTLLGRGPAPFDALLARGPAPVDTWVPEDTGLEIEQVVARFTPANALSLIAGHALVIEGADNYATKFLAADAAKLARVPVVQAGAVRLSGWALASLPDAGACLRCVFEDIPRGQPETCAVAGVLGPVVGVLGALEAALAVQLLLGELRAASTLWSYDALSGKLRRRKFSRRPGCPLCEGRITALEQERYETHCAA